MSKILELARKFYELAKRGEGGEQINAQKMLQKIMDEHDLTIEDVEGEEVTEHCFTIPLNVQYLFHQVANSVILNVQIFGAKELNAISNNYYIDCTAEKAIEIQMKMNFYSSLFEREYNIFYRAFVQKNKIFHPDMGSNNYDEMSEEEKKEMLRVQEMMQTITKGDFFKQIDTNH